MVNIMNVLQITFVSSFVVILSACFGQTPTPHPSIIDLSTFEFVEMIKNDGILIDVQTLEEFDEAHLEKAIQMDYYSDAFEKVAMELPKEKVVYVYCRSGSRSASASKIFLEQGHPKVYNLTGGITEWQNAGLPVFSE